MFPTAPHFLTLYSANHVHTLRPQGSALRGKYCHIPYLTSKPFKSNSDVFGLTSDLCSDVTSTLLLLTLSLLCNYHYCFSPFLLPLLSPVPYCPLLSPYLVTSDLHSDLHSYLQHPRIIILIIYPLVTCSDHLRITPSCPHI